MMLSNPPFGAAFQVALQVNDTLHITELFKKHFPPARESRVVE
jgi:hypothetical protein